MQAPDFSLKDRLVVLTGGGRGLGLQIAETMKAAGARLVIAELDPETGQAAADRLDGDFVQVDVADPDSVRAMVRQVLERHGRIDVLVNNAGVARNTPAEEISDKEWRHIVGIDLYGVFWCCREVGRHMLERGKGAIVNIASMSGSVSNHPQPQCHYNAAKAGVIMLTKSLAGEWADRGVRVNSVSPGYIGTEMTLRGRSNKAWFDTWLQSTPMKRVAEPSEIAPAVVYLASDASSFATGTDLVIDGGYTSW